MQSVKNTCRGHSEKILLGLWGTAFWVAMETMFNQRRLRSFAGRTITYSEYPESCHPKLTLIPFRERKKRQYGVDRSAMRT